MDSTFRINKIILCLLLPVCVILKGKSQEIVPDMDVKSVVDTVKQGAATDSVTQEVLKAADLLVLSSPEELRVVEPFKPNPTRALLYSAIVPGLGQIYNRKYWKLPILYGGLMGCMYAITWNNKNYEDYSNAYWGVLQEDPLAQKELWKHFVQGTIDWNDDDAMLAKANDTSFQSQLKRKKDYFRRYRDMSIFIGLGVYFLGMLDAYVDAHLFDFDISPDLSMRVEPIVTRGNSYSPHVYGINCSIKF